MLSFFRSGLCSLGYEYFNSIGLDTVTGCYPSVDATSINGIILVVAGKEKLFASFNRLLRIVQNNYISCIFRDILRI